MYVCLCGYLCVCVCVWVGVCLDTYLYVTAKFMSHNNFFAHNHIDHYVIVYFTDHYLVIEGAAIPNLTITINGSLSMALTATLQSSVNLSQVLNNYEL